MDLAHQLNWRYATNRHTNKMTTEKLHFILDNIRSSGSAFGFLPHNILAIDSTAQIDRILPTSYYPQPEKASHLLVFTAWTGIRHENINELMAYIAASKGLSLDKTSDYKEVMKILVKSKADYHREWSTKQAYIALGIGLTAAGEQKLDAFPIEQFERETLDKTLNLKEKGMTGIVMLALGKRDESDAQVRSTKKPERKRDMPLPFMMGMGS